MSKILCKANHSRQYLASIKTMKNLQVVYYIWNLPTTREILIGEMYSKHHRLFWTGFITSNFQCFFFQQKKNNKQIKSLKLYYEVCIFIQLPCFIPSKIMDIMSCKPKSYSTIKSVNHGESHVDVNTLLKYYTTWLRIRLHGTTAISLTQEMGYTTLKR